MALSVGDREQAVRWEEPVHLQILQLAYVRPVAVHAGPLGIDHAEHAAVEHRIPGEQPAAAIDLGEIAEAIHAVPSDVNGEEPQTPHT